MGAVCAAGCGIKNAWTAVKEGKDCLSHLSIFDCGLKNPPLCGQIKEFTDNFNSPNKTSAFSCAAVNEALANIKNRKGLSFGLVFATTVGGITKSEIFYREFKKDQKLARIAEKELAYHEPCSISGFLCKVFNLKGFLTISTACSTGLHAIGIAKKLVEKKIFDVCIALGSDALSILTIRGFASLTLIDSSGCKPFDKRRAGISLGEGAGAIVIASKEAANKLEIEPIAQICGWGASADCYHMTAPDPSGKGAIKAIENAILDAALNSHYIDMISSHGTATPDNDSAEIMALKTIFNNNIPPFFSLKRTLGHTLAASGVIESIFSIIAMNSKIIPPTAGFEVEDDNLGFIPTYFNNIEIKYFLKNSFGFGGNNAACIFAKNKIGEN
jgi:3-oxoacyl-[acyl-carrier-protein] synthase-1